MDKIVAGEPETRSADILAENLDRLKALFPEAFTEGKVDFEVLRQLLGGTVNESEEKYGLNWHGKRSARQLALTPSTGTLRPCPEDSINWHTTQNLMIEGDNLEVLKLLQKSYAGKVKLIYIDPPYNTGKDFVYTDDYKDSIRSYLGLTGQIDCNGQKISSNVDSSGRYHTAWLNMMYPRLKTCRNLLTKDGILFISVDDTEIHNLRLMCNDVFGEECFVGCISRVTGTPTGGGNRALVGEIDYLLVFSRTPNAIVEGINFTDEDARIYSKEDEKGKYLTRTIRRTGGEDRREDRPTMYYPLTAPDGTLVYPIGPTGYESRWICGPERFQEMDSQGLIEWEKVNNNGSDEWQVYQKFYLEGRSKQPSNFWSKVEGNKKATRDLRAMFDGEKVFTFPKPVGLIRQIIQVSGLSDNDIVLDFFAGSGTTAQAVMEQEAIDGVSRRFILVQLPEPLDVNLKEQASGAAFCDRMNKPRNIAELTKERLRRSASQVSQSAPMHTGDLGFRVFKLDTSNIRVWDTRPEDLEDAMLSQLDHIEPGRTEQDILYELLLKLGLDLCIPIETRTIASKSVHSVGAGTLIACLDESISRDDVEPLALGVADWHDAFAPAGDSTVVFRDSAFVDDVAKSNLAETLKQRGLGSVRSL